MTKTYAEEVERFGSPQPFVDEHGRRLNISHADEFEEDTVQTDGVGNITMIPLLRKKECFGRPERCIRGMLETNVWVDKGGYAHPGKNRCTSCKEGSPGVYTACGIVALERCESDSTISHALDNWTTACGTRLGPSLFVSQNGRLWRTFLKAIIKHGGWSNINDDQVKIEALRKAEENKKKVNASARKRRKLYSDSRRGSPRFITPPYLAALEAERNKRAKHLKSIRGASTRAAQDSLWLKNLPDATCERIADVWQAREYLRRTRCEQTGKAILQQMVEFNKQYESTSGSLLTRVYDDLKRLKKLEADPSGSPLWPKWKF